MVTVTMADFFAGGGGSIPEPTYAGATGRDANGRLWARGDRGSRWSTDDPPWVADLRWGPLVRAFGPIREETSVKQYTPQFLANVFAAARERAAALATTEGATE